MNPNFQKSFCFGVITKNLLSILDITQKHHKYNKKASNFLLAFSLNTLFWRLPTFANKTIIGTSELNFSVRNGKRCTSPSKHQNIIFKFYIFIVISKTFLLELKVLVLVKLVSRFKFYCDFQIS